MKNDERLKSQIAACYNKLLDKTVLNTDMVKIIEAYRFIIQRYLFFLLNILLI